MSDVIHVNVAAGLRKKGMGYPEMSLRELMMQWREDRDPVVPPPRDAKRLAKLAADVTADLEASEHSKVRLIPKTSGFIHILNILDGWKRYGGLRTKEDHVRLDLLEHRLEASVALLRKCRSAIGKIPRENDVVDFWKATIDGLLAEVALVHGFATPPDKRRRQADERRTFIARIAWNFLYGGDGSLPGLTQEPEGFFARAMEILCGVADVPFPSDPKDRRAVLKQTLEICHRLDPHLKVVEGPSTVERGRREALHKVGAQRSAKTREGPPR